MNKLNVQTIFKKYFYFCIFIVLLCILVFVNFENLHNWHKSNKNLKLVQQHNQYNFPSLQVLQVDKILQKLSKNYIDHDFVHPLAKTNHNHTPFGHKMKTIKEIVQATKVLVEPKMPCEKNYGKNLSLVVLIPVAIDNVKRRNLIRHTYGSTLKNNPKTSIYFLIGKNNNSKIQTQMKTENLLHNDIIQFDFDENYYNLTLKTIAAIRWTALNCYKARFVLKLDTDTYIRTNLFLSQIRHLSLNCIYGSTRGPKQPNHNKLSKFYIDPLYFPYKTYPPAVLTTYFIPGSLFGKLYHAIISKPQNLTIPALPIEDLYVSILAFKAKIKLLRFPGITWRGNEKKLLNYNSKSLLIGNISAGTILNSWKLSL